MKTIIQKLSFDSKEAREKIQLRIEKDEVNGSLIDILKGQKLKLEFEASQSNINIETGELENKTVLIPSETISASVCCLEDGQIWTITVTFSDIDIAKSLIESDLIGKAAYLKFI